MEENKQVYENGSIQPYGIMPLTQEESNYNPFGFTEQRGCATCRWFIPSSNSCYVVQGAIVATGLSDMYQPLRPQDQMAELLEDFAEEMSEMDMGEASVSEEKQQKPSLIARLFSRKSKPEDKPLFDTPTGFKSVGDNLWVAWYSNSYLDRDGEYFAEKSLEADIAFMQETGNYPSLWRFHVGSPSNEATKHGKALTVTKSGRFVIAIGEFDDTPLGHAMKAYYEEHPDQGVSHGFYYDPALKMNGVYTKHHTFEISTLPANLAANEYASFGIKEGSKMATASDKQLADLKAVLQGRLSDDELQKVLQAAAQKSAELDQHVSHKAEKEDEKAKEPELSADTKALLGALSDLKSSFTSLSTDIAALKAKMDKEDMMEDEEDEEYEGGKKPKKKQRDNANTLSPEITKMLRGLVEDQQLNQDAKGIDERELDPASFILSKALNLEMK